MCSNGPEEFFSKKSSSEMTELRGKFQAARRKEGSFAANLSHIQIWKPEGKGGRKMGQRLKEGGGRGKGREEEGRETWGCRMRDKLGERGRDGARE